MHRAVIKILLKWVDTIALKLHMKLEHDDWQPESKVLFNDETDAVFSWRTPNRPFTLDASIRANSVEQMQEQLRLISESLSQAPSPDSEMTKSSSVMLPSSPGTLH